jgi:RNA polymerase sigma-70 factor (ECF subfamily)
MVGDPREAEDIVQDSFLTLWRKAHELDPGRGTVRALLMTIVHRRSLDVLRRRGRRREIDLTVAEHFESDAPGPAEEAATSQRRAAIVLALNDLPVDQRVAVEATYFGGLTINEFAKKASIPLGTAKSRLRLALERLRRLLPEIGEL